MPNNLSTGLGAAFVRHYLSRPNHIVIGTLRSPTGAAADALRTLPTAPNSKLILTELEYTDPPSAARMIEDLKTTHGITKLDVVVANAGVTGQQGPMSGIDPAGLQDVYMVNAVGPALLFLALHALLEKASQPKWCSISTATSSIENAHFFAAFPGFAYAASKAALNSFTRAMHVENERIVAFAVHPGYVVDFFKARMKAYAAEWSADQCGQ
jgi:NAD(P)-dependent dehydrogenase (short-subunit alcohol dehydrogenase family)